MGRAGIRRSVVAVGAALLLVGIVPPVRGDVGALSGTFTALTYNVAGLPEPLSGSEPATNSPLISALLDDYDLVLLQENWADPFAEQRRAGLIGEQVPRLGYHDVVVADAHHAHRSEPAPAPPPPAIERFPTGPALSGDGLNRLSDFAFGPLARVMWDECHGELAVTVVEEVLKGTGLDDVLDDAGAGAVNDAAYGGATDCAAHKGFSVARTELAPGVVVDVYNLHAEAGSSEADRRASRAGYEQLAAYIAEHSAGHAVILGGDTNLHTERPDRLFDAETWTDFLATTGLHDVCDVVACGADAGVIDKFAFRSTAAVEILPESHRFEREKFRRGDGEPLSDHDALAVTFRWVAG